jgi:hypothetical protein
VVAPGQANCPHHSLDGLYQKEIRLPSDQDQKFIRNTMSARVAHALALAEKRRRRFDRIITDSEFLYSTVT